MKTMNVDRYDQVEKLNLPYTVQVWYHTNDLVFDSEEPEEWWFETYQEAKLQFKIFKRKEQEPRPTHLMLLKYGYCIKPESSDCMDEWDIDDD